ncbi:unnamed protein product [Trifolium pratense]|uniref:Uncharacterized protein n=1 Tax=Trifolium pratense TaxID=57577 RepID=A0ACB0INH2_TRIPR|nr:unnamed protein product [Trifolium pratense]
MVPLGKTPTTSSRKKTTRRRRTTTNKKKHLPHSKIQETSSDLSSSKDKDMDSVKVVDDDDVSTISNNSVCSTPKGRKFRIPEISTCPPAPKKQRVLSNFSLRRVIFAPPDLENFLCVALQDSLASFVC